RLRPSSQAGWNAISEKYQTRMVRFSARSVGRLRNGVGERFRLLPMGEMAGVRDHPHPGTRNRRPEALAVLRRDDAVLLTPQQGSWNVDAMQPALEARVVHIRLPAELREGLLAAHDGGEVALGNLRVIDGGFGRIGPGQLDESLARDGVHVGDVAVGDAAVLDAERVDQHEAAEPAR